MNTIYDNDNIGIDRDSNVSCNKCIPKQCEDDYSVTTYWEGDTLTCSECNDKIYPTYPTEEQQNEINEDAYNDACKDGK